MNAPIQETIPDIGLACAALARYPASGPRYTSYPTADRFHDRFTASDYGAALQAAARERPDQPWSLYVHVPFCATLCFYCGCNKIATKNYSLAETYVGYLARELELIAPLLQAKPTLGQLHFGGGTPTFLQSPEWRLVWQAIQKTFTILPDAEISVEIDPRRVTPVTLDTLFELGVNRISVGVQDFDPDVQRAVNRVQSLEETRAVIDRARQHGCRSVNIDLIYGLPLQTVERFDKTLDSVIALSPERIALYHYAHLPAVFMPQRRIRDEDLPSSETKMQLFALALSRLRDAGYVYIGMDHFAKPDDELAVAQREGKLQRNFQGYSTAAELDLIGIGVSSISKVGQVYSQSAKTLTDYYRVIDEGQLPVMRGYALNEDDVIRRGVIGSLMCNGRLLKDEFRARHGVDFDAYFAEEIPEVRKLAADGVVEVRADGLHVTSLGRFLLRPLCMVFDRHLKRGHTLARYSRVA
jgi:oxygen-independent coproporphyrinogen-3 oxidase